MDKPALLLGVAGMSGFTKLGFLYFPLFLILTLAHAAEPNCRYSLAEAKAIAHDPLHPDYLEGIRAYAQYRPEELKVFLKALTQIYDGSIRTRAKELLTIYFPNKIYSASLYFAELAPNPEDQKGTKLRLTIENLTEEPIRFSYRDVTEFLELECESQQQKCKPKARLSDPVLKQVEILGKRRAFIDIDFREFFEVPGQGRTYCVFSGFLSLPGFEASPVRFGLGAHYFLDSKIVDQK